jgi:hypothetical protein
MEFQILYQELVNSANIIRSLLAGISQADAQVKPAPDSWSILEVACHLYDEEREDFRQRLDIILHRPDEEWPPIDPGGWVTARRYNERDFAEVMDQLSAEREKSLEWLRGLVEPNWNAIVQTPFRTMTAGDMLSSWVAHDNLHMRQLVELRRGRILNITDPYDVGYAGDW